MEAGKAGEMQAVADIRRASSSQFGQTIGRVAELFQVNSAFVHHREEQAAHLAVRLAAVVQHSARFQFPAASTEEHDGQLGRVVNAGHHAGTHHQHRVIERGSFAFLNCVQLAGDVAELFQAKLVHLQPAG